MSYLYVIKFTLNVSTSLCDIDDYIEMIELQKTVDLHKWCEKTVVGQLQREKRSGVV